ncbi:MAG TPA: biopolymer transporter ExbD [Longimicrobium sp.]|nr:biopolymer transporter ExbD [Longimicrobium sp.]
MSMGGLGGKGGSMSEINMTPMIDVLLVLLIIFMVVQQGLQRGLSVQVPPPKEKEEIAQKPPDDSQIVLEVEPGPRYLVNRQEIPAANLEAFLRETFAQRARKVIFVKGANDLPYGEVVRAVDASRAADIALVGLVPLPEQGPATVVAPPAP